MDESTKTKLFVGYYPEVTKVALAAFIAFVALTFTAGHKIDLENLAKGEENTSRIELYKGTP